jgi:hypothetical protein
MENIYALFGYFNRTFRVISRCHNCESGHGRMEDGWRRYATEHTGQRRLSIAASQEAHPLNSIQKYVDDRQ